jgi:hypothetical protein
MDAAAELSRFRVPGHRDRAREIASGIVLMMNEGGKNPGEVHRLVVDDFFNRTIRHRRRRDRPPPSLRIEGDQIRGPPEGQLDAAPAAQQIAHHGKGIPFDSGNEQRLSFFFFYLPNSRGDLLIRGKLRIGCQKLAFLSKEIEKLPEIANHVDLRNI